MLQQHLIEKHELTSPDALQLELNVRAYKGGPMGGGDSDDRKAHQKRVQELMASDDSLRLDPMGTAFLTWMSMRHLIGFSTASWDAGLLHRASKVEKSVMHIAISVYEIEDQ